MICDRTAYNDEPEMLWLESTFKRGSTNRLKEFLRSGGDPNLDCCLGSSILNRAVWFHNVQATEILLEHGAKPYSDDPWDFNTLCNAAFNGYPDIVKLLLDQGVEVDSVWMQSTTALHEACMMRCGHPCPAWDIKDKPHSQGELDRFLECATLLIDAGADVNAICLDWPGPTEGFTPLHFAVEANCLPMVKLLIDNGADIHITEDEGKTPHELACEYGRTEIADYLASLVDDGEHVPGDG